MKERNYYKNKLCTKGKFILRRKEELMNFHIMKVDVMDFWEQKKSFSTK